MYQQMVSFQIGKYDTYKGSTQSVIISFFTITTPGNMILIKDRHEQVGRGSARQVYLGNMILIKDRHTYPFGEDLT